MKQSQLLYIYAIAIALTELLGKTLAFNDYNDDKAIIDAGGVPVLLAALAPDTKSEKKRTRVDLQVLSCAVALVVNLIGLINATQGVRCGHSAQSTAM